MVSQIRTWWPGDCPAPGHEQCTQCVETPPGSHGRSHPPHLTGMPICDHHPGLTLDPTEVIVSDTLAARIRTAWPLLLGHLAALVAGWILKLTGVEIDNAIVFEALSFALSYGVWALGGWLEKRPNPVLAAIGRWLISAGRQIGAPTYPGGSSQSTPDTVVR